MRRSILTSLVAASLLLACRTGRSGVEMAEELARLEKGLSAAEADVERTAEERRALERELEAEREAYERARLTYDRRDRLRAELEAAGYSPSAAEAYATVAVPGEGQVRRGAEVATAGGAGTSGPKRPLPGAPHGRYAGPHTIHVVAKGECLYRIASYRRYYGDGEKWPIIYETNAYQIKDPHWIFVKQRLQIPTP